MNVSVELAGAVQAVLRLRRVHPIYPPYGYLHRRITSLVAPASVEYAQSTGRGSRVMSISRCTLVAKRTELATGSTTPQHSRACRGGLTPLTRLTPEPSLSSSACYALPTPARYAQGPAVHIFKINERVWWTETSADDPAAAELQYAPRLGGGHRIDTYAGVYEPTSSR